MDIGQAVRVLRDGGRVARRGWNGQGMWLVLVPSSTFTVEEGRPLGSAAPHLVGERVEYREHIDIRTTSGRIGPWVSNSGDLLADDWYVVG